MTVIEKNISGFITETGNDYLKTATILVIDRDAGVYLNIKTLLGKDYNVIGADNESKALQHIHRELPNLILCDSLITTSDKTSLLRILKQDPKTEKIPVILLSESADEGGIETYDADANDYLIKPFSANELIARVRLQLKIIIEKENSELKVKNLLLSVPIAICIFRGPKYIVELANENMLRFWGRNLDHVLDKPVFECMPDLGGQGFEELLAHVYTTGERFVTSETPITLLRNGVSENVFIKLVYEALFDEDGTISGVIAAADEITEQVVIRKKIEESEVRFRMVTNLMPAKITNANPAGAVIYCNKEWLDFTGVDFEDFKNFGYYNVMHPDELFEFQNRFQNAVKTGTDLEMEMRFMNLNGEYKWHLNRASPVKNGNGDIEMWIGVTTEIQKLKEEEKRKGEFLQMVSHELRTPITSIKGYVGILLRMLKEEHEKYFHPMPLRASLVRIDVQIIRLTKLISEILDLSRLEEGRLELKHDVFNLNELVVDTIEDIRFTNLSLNINLIQEVNCNILGDKDRIGQVMINLINNGIKYSPAKQPIEVRIHQPEKNQVAVSIMDYGIGIDKKDQERIFERYYRVEGQNENKFAGLGIGLFITDQIIKRHNGFMTIESEKGKGSVFTFTLPLTITFNQL